MIAFPLARLARRAYPRHLSWVLRTNYSPLTNRLQDMALGEVLRTSLLERLERASPAIIAFAAPAGFGKSTLMRQFMARRSGRICDCADVHDDLDLARRLLPEAAGELDDGGASVSERLDRALAAWAGVPARWSSKTPSRSIVLPEAARFSNGCSRSARAPRRCFCAAATARA